MNNTMKKKLLYALAIVLACAACLTACGSESSTTVYSNKASKESSETKSAETDAAAPAIEGLTYESTLKLDYAKCFSVYKYQGGYSLIAVNDGRNYFIVPDGAETPSSLDSSYIVLKQPLDHIYLAATAAMCEFDSLDAIDHVLLSGEEADGWYIDSAKAAMESGAMLYAGKYSAPDYESLVKNRCDVAIESTMILHSPDVQEKIEELGIPVLIDRASYEPEPMGRTEWVKVYGVLTGKEDKAEEVFEEQKKYEDALADFTNTESTVAFFYVNSNGMVVTRKSSDYIPRMIEIAGGRYIFKDLGSDDDTASSAVNMGMEEFYASAKDADYIVYNASIEDPINSIQELVDKNAMFADFKAVKSGNVWCTDKSLYQASNVNGTVINDMHIMLTGGSTDDVKYLRKLQ